MRVKWQDRMLLLYQTCILTLSAVQGSQLCWHSFCAIKVKHSSEAPGQLIKMTWSFVFPFICESFSVGSELLLQYWEVALFTLTLLGNFSFMKHRALHYVFPLGPNRTALCLRLTPSIHILAIFRGCFFVLCWCPPSFPHRLQSAVPGAIFDYMPLQLNLQETVLTQGDSLSQGIPRVHLWLELKAILS